MDTRPAEKYYQFRLSISAAQLFGDMLALLCDVLRLFFKLLALRGDQVFQFLILS